MGLPLCWRKTTEKAQEAARAKDTILINNLKGPEFNKIYIFLKGPDEKLMDEYIPLGVKIL